MLAEYLVFAAYLLLGPFTWAIYALGMNVLRFRLRLIERHAPDLPSPAPRAVILIPAKNEQERIADCVLSALRQDYPDFGVIAIDDRSDDRTPQVLDELAAAHPRLKVIHIPHGSLPDGWTGKCNALQVAQAHADGQWLLFVDSDVILRPQALRQAVAVAESRRYGMVSLALKLETPSLMTSLLMPLAAAAIMGMYRIVQVNQDRLRDVGFANGQFILVRRDAYDRMGRHEAVRDRFTEDVELGRIAKKLALRPRFAWGMDLASVRMYDSLPSLLRGWARNFYGIGGGSPWRMLAVAAFIVFCCFSAYADAGWGVYRMIHPINMFEGWGWLGAAAVHLVVMTWALSRTYAWTGNPPRNALLFPVSGLLMLILIAKALRLCMTGNVTWRGDAYSRPRAA